jgi:uncharacterized delta-60 repeat protein
MRLKATRSFRLDAARKLSIAIPLAFFLASCGVFDGGGSGSGGSGTGGITAQARWPAPGFIAPRDGNAVTLPDSVVTVRATVSGSDMDSIEASFDADLGEGVIDNVPVGTDRTLTLEGLDDTDAVVYYTEITGITVTEGETQDAGTADFLFVGDGGGLDLSFGSAGLAIGSNSSAAQANAIALDSMGRVYIAGQVQGSSNLDMAIWRFTSAGAADSTYGTSGRTTHNNAATGNGDDAGSDLVIDGNDLALVAGWSRNPSADTMAVWRLDGNGGLDTTYGEGDGVFTVSNSATAHDRGFGITLDSLERAMVTGETQGASNYAMIVWRLTTGGVLESTPTYPSPPGFGGSGSTRPGYVTHDNSAGMSGNDAGYAITLDDSQRILVAGTSQSANPVNGVWRLVAGDTGALDTGFNLSGFHYSAAGTTYAVVTDSSTNVFAAGTTGFSSAFTFSAWRLTGTTGSLDPAFGGGDGMFTETASCRSSVETAHARAVALDSVGRVVLAGTCIPIDETEPTLIVVRLNSDGTLDTSFGNGAGVIFVYNESAADPEIEATDLVVTDDAITVSGWFTGDDGLDETVVVRLKP